MNNEPRGFSWGHFGIGILFILAALIAFSNPEASLVSLVIFFGVLAILKGCFSLFIRRKLAQYTNVKSTGLIVIGIIDIVLGGLILGNIEIGIVTLPVLFAIWFILDSISNLATSGISKLVSNTYYWFTIIINILGIIIGVMLLANPVSSALSLVFLVGFYFMWMGILNVIAAFSKE